MLFCQVLKIAQYASPHPQALHTEVVCVCGRADTRNTGIDLISSKYRARITDTDNTDTETDTDTDINIDTGTDSNVNTDGNIYAERDISHVSINVFLCTF